MTENNNAASGQAGSVSGSESQAQDDTGKMVHTSSRGKLRKNPAAIRRVLNRVAEGESVRAACRAENVSRRAFIRICETVPEWRERMAFSVAARAHAIADSIAEIAEGTDTADATALAVARAMEGAAPGKAETAARAVVRERIGRDRLRFDAARWLASRLLPQTYGTQGTTQPNGPMTIHIVHEPLPPHLTLPHGTATPDAARDRAPEIADFEVLGDE